MTVTAELVLKEYANDFATGFLDTLFGGNTKLKIWQLEHWKFIERAISDEGECVCDAGPAAVFVYERLVRMAITYLMKFPREKERRWLKRLVAADIQECKLSLAALDAKHVPDEMREGMRVAMERILGSLRQLH